MQNKKAGDKAAEKAEETDCDNFSNNDSQYLDTTKEVKKWGDSLVITLNDISDILELQEGDVVKLTVSVFKKKMKGGRK